MKAWLIREKNEFCCEVVYAETRGKARALAKCTDCCEDARFTDIEVTRMQPADKYYKDGKWHLDWEDPQDRIILVKECGFVCDWDYFDLEDCETCSAKEYCDRYKDHIQESAEGTETMCIEHRGYFIQQSSYNNHIMIIKDDRMVLHSACTEKKTEAQLRGIVDGYIKFLESGNVADIWQDGEG